MPDQPTDGELDVVNQMANAENPESTERTELQPSGAAQPRKRGRPRKHVDPAAMPEKSPKPPKKTPVPRIPKRILNALEAKNLVTFTAEDVEHVRTIQRRIQTCVNRNIRYLQSLPERVSVGARDAEGRATEPAFAGISGISQGFLLGDEMTLERLALDLLPFHVYSSLQESPLPSAPHERLDGAEERLSEKTREMLTKADGALQANDERSSLNPMELLLIEKKLFLEEEKFILSLTKQEFFKRFGMHYSSNMLQPSGNGAEPRTTGQ